MELMFVLLWVLVALLNYLLWVLLKTFGTFHHIFEQLQQWIRSGLGVAGVKELKDIQEKLFGLERQIYVREVFVTTADKLQLNFRNVLKKWTPLLIALSLLMTHSLPWTHPFPDAG